MIVIEAELTFEFFLCWYMNIDRSYQFQLVMVGD